jgi:acetyltransferase-like isoleucine patch superfamily enzyme
LASLQHDWFPSPLPENVIIGQNSWLYSSFAFRHFNSARQPAVKIGRSTGIYNGSFFDLGPDGDLRIGDFCTMVGAIVCSNRSIVIGDYVFIAHEVVLADEPVAVPGTPETLWRLSGASNSGRKHGIVIGNDVWIGAGACILGGARLGDGVIVGAGAVVDFVVPDNTLVAGNPAFIVEPKGEAV